MIEKSAVTPTDFVHLDRTIKAFWCDEASAQKQRRRTGRLRDHFFSCEDLIGFRVRAESEANCTVLPNKSLSSWTGSPTLRPIRKRKGALATEPPL
jgi:hypothetical protein